MNRKILYIISDTRSGSTLLENILSKSEEIVSVGELRLLESHLNHGRYGKTWDWKCSCGKDFSNCEFWSKIFNDLKSKNIENIENTCIQPLINKKFNFNIQYDKLHNRKAINILNEIYSSIFKITNKNIIIDSSKNPTQAIALYQNTHFDFKVIFLKRDIRAVCFSKRKWHYKFTKKKLNLYRLLYATKKYDLKVQNAYSLIAKDDKITISYEDLSKTPQDTINRIIQKFNLNYFSVPQYMYLENNHTVAGTPNRFKKSEIKYDNSWEKQSQKKLIFNFIASIIDKF